VVSTGYSTSAPRVSGRRAGMRAPAGPIRERVLVGLEVFIALCGLGGGIYLATHPATAMPLSYLRGTWFQSWRWPGIALFFFVGLCPLLVAVATLQGRSIASVGHLCVGIGLISWVALEAAWIVVSPGLQIAVGAIGAVILVLGVREWTSVDHGRRSNRSD